MKIRTKEEIRNDIFLNEMRMLKMLKKARLRNFELNLELLQNKIVKILEDDKNEE